MRIRLQHDESDCGAACLAMVAEHYGYVDSIRNFRKLANTAQDGTDLDDMIIAAESIGFESDALEGDIEHLITEVSNGEIVLPFIAHWITEDNLTHYVVVSKIDNNGFVIFDPAKGKVRVVVDEFLERWDGCIMTLVPTESFKKQRNKSNDVLSFFSLLKGQGKRFAAIILISAIISGIGIAGAFAFQLIIDHSTEMVEISEGVHDHHEHDVEFLTNSEVLNDALEGISDFFGNLTAEGVSKIFICLIGLYIIAGIIQYVRGRLIIAMSKEIDLNLSLPYFNRIMDLPVSSILTRRTGDYMSRYSDTSDIRNAISAGTITMIVDTMMAVGCGVILYFQNFRLFLIAMAIIIIYAAVMFGNNKRIKDSNRVFMENSAYIQSYMKESIDGVQAVKSVNASEHVISNMAHKFNKYIDAAIRKSGIVMGQEVLVTVIETVGISVILWQGFAQVISGDMELGALITFYALLGYLITPVKNLIDLQPVVQSAVVAAERLEDIMTMDVESVAGQDMREAGNIRKWMVKDLTFRYGHMDPVLDGVTLSFDAGQKVAVVGKSGSGKTTLAKLFTRFYEPESGDILVDGESLSEYSVESLRSVISYVSSDTGVFSGTILENLTLGLESFTDEDVEKVCEITKIDEILDDVPGARFGLKVEESGANLSSGQKQRIAIARALLRNPQLLILDEATANLDPRMESEILQEIAKQRPDMAILMITHRLSSMKCYDRIIYLQDGKTDGEGKHEELQNNCEAYRKFIADENYTP